MTVRIRCTTPGCKRTVSPVAIKPEAEWVCHRCWRGVPKAMRMAYARAKRNLRYYTGTRHEAKWIARCATIWQDCKAAAVEGRAGI